MAGTGREQFCYGLRSMICNRKTFFLQNTKVPSASGKMPNRVTLIQLCEEHLGTTESYMHLISSTALLLFYNDFCYNYFDIMFFDKVFLKVV